MRAASITATQLRTAALVILTSEVLPNLGNTCTFSVISPPATSPLTTYMPSTAGMLAR